MQLILYHTSTAANKIMVYTSQVTCQKLSGGASKRLHDGWTEGQTDEGIENNRKTKFHIKFKNSHYTETYVK